jgi:hypothetical protein
MPSPTFLHNSRLLLRSPWIAPVNFLSKPQGCRLHGILAKSPRCTTETTSCVFPAQVLFLSRRELRRCIHKSPFTVSVRYKIDQVKTTTRTRSPELDSNVRSPETTPEPQKELPPKTNSGNDSAKNVDILGEGTVSKSEQKKVNWRILLTLVKYIWPKVCMFDLTSY